MTLNVMGTKTAAEKWGKSQSHVKNTILAGEIVEIDGVTYSRGKIEAMKIGKEWVIDVNHPNPFSDDEGNMRKLVWFSYKRYYHYDKKIDVISGFAPLHIYEQHRQPIDEEPLPLSKPTGLYKIGAECESYVPSTFFWGNRESCEEFLSGLSEISNLLPLYDRDLDHSNTTEYTNWIRATERVREHYQTKTGFIVDNDATAPHIDEIKSVVGDFALLVKTKNGYEVWANHRNYGRYLDDQMIKHINGLVRGVLSQSLPMKSRVGVFKSEFSWA